MRFCDSCGLASRVRAALLVFVLCLLPSRSDAQGLTTIQSTGDSANRVDLVFIGDGYTATELGTTYGAEVDEMVSYMFSSTSQPLQRYSSFFNIHRVEVASNESGADAPQFGIEKDTALGATYQFDGVTDRLLYFNVGLVDQAVNLAIEGTSIDVDMRIGIVNDSIYGGGGGDWAVYAGGNSSSNEIAVHELGHSFAGLTDEYFTPGTTYSGVEPSFANATADPTLGKWDRWLGYDDPSNTLGPVGYYEGGYYVETGVFRPTFNSKMRSLFQPFDAVSREAFLGEIYNHVDPLDGWLEGSAVLGEQDTAWIDTLDDDIIDVEWSVDGQLVNQQSDTLSVDSLGLTPGVYTLTARGYDNILLESFTGSAMDWWRLDEGHLSQSVSWVVSLLPGDFIRDGEYTCEDINALMSAIAEGSQEPSFDLNGDGAVDLADRNSWLAEAEVLLGDLDLEYGVDSTDLGRLINNFTRKGTPHYCVGNLDGSPSIDSTDLGLLLNKFTGTLVPVLTVPESGLSHAAWFGICAVMLLRRVRHRPR